MADIYSSRASANLKENIASIILPDKDISDNAIFLLERHAMSDGMRTVDSIIAATALNSSAALATGNFKHFKNIPHLKIMKFKRPKWVRPRKELYRLCPSLIAIPYPLPSLPLTNRYPLPADFQL